MTLVDYIILIVGLLIILTYTTIKIAEFIKQKKYFNECLAKGMTKETAKEETRKHFNKTEKLDPKDKEVKE